MSALRMSLLIAMTLAGATAQAEWYPTDDLPPPGSAFAADIWPFPEAAIRDLRLTDFSAHRPAPGSDTVGWWLPMSANLKGDLALADGPFVPFVVPVDMTYGVVFEYNYGGRRGFTGGIQWAIDGPGTLPVGVQLRTTPQGIPHWVEILDRTVGFEITGMGWGVIEMSIDDGATWFPSGGEMMLIPEPGTWMLVAGGLGVAAGLRRVRQGV